MSRLLNGLRQSNLHPIIIQKEFKTFEPEILDQLENDYAEMAQRDSQQEYIDIQAKIGMAPTQSFGQGYGTYPLFRRYREALENSKNTVTVSGERCHMCQGGDAAGQLLPCKHCLCSACLEDAQASKNCLLCKADIIDVRTAERTSTDQDQDTGVRPVGCSKSRRRKEVNDFLPQHDWLKLKGTTFPSTKCRVAKLKILQWLSEDQEVKIVIFTHWIKAQVHFGKI